MIETKCNCGWTWAQSESAPKLMTACLKCRRRLSLACAEALPEGAGAGDFDAMLEVVAGPPERVGERIFLGGVVELPAGKLDGSAIHLPGKMVSRRHCHFTRVDFGPSKWSVADDESTNGLFVNDRRVSFKEMADGDVVAIGEYKLRFGHTQPHPAVVVTAAGGGGGGGASI